MVRPERIFLLLDVDAEWDTKDFGGGKEARQKRWTVLQEALSAFIIAKLAMPAGHKISLVALRQRPILEHDFCGNPTPLLRTLAAMQPEYEYKDFNMAHLATFLSEQRAACADDTDSVWRAIFIYGRSHVVPAFQRRLPDVDPFLNDPECYFDVLYVFSRKVSPKGMPDPQHVWNALTLLEAPHRRDVSLMLQAAGAARLTKLVMLLLGHPLQRRPDRMTDETLAAGTAALHFS